MFDHIILFLLLLTMFPIQIKSIYIEIYTPEFFYVKTGFPVSGYAIV